jgi:hypothetical protein
MFDIREFINFNPKGRAICPACAITKGADYKTTTLTLIPNTDGAYKCHRGCTPEDIRAALGQEKERILPTALAQTKTPTGSTTITPQKIREAHDRLMASDGPAKQWLHDRGIDDGLIQRHQLGIGRAKVGDRHLYAISIPLPANADGTQFWQKKRIAPWLSKEEQPADYSPWSQYGIPPQVFLTWLPAGAKETWLCEGEWDAMLLGKLLRDANVDIAVASFTCGASTVPPKEQLDLLPGTVAIFYDRNDKPLKNGKIPGDEGAKKVAAALGDRGRIAQVPMPEGCDHHGWDVSDAINAKYGLTDFTAAAVGAIAPPPEQAPATANPLKANLEWNDDLLDTAPDYTEWLVPDLLTANELFLLASGPRTGKSLLSMSLSLAVAQGSEFMGRPTTQGAVLYVVCEDSRAKIKEREIAQGWSKGLPVAWLRKFKLSEMRHLRDLVAEMDPRLVVIDTLSRVKDAGISESSAEMSQVLEPLQEMAEELNTCVVLVHHTGKVNVENMDRIDIFETVRGSSAIRAVCRGSMIIGKQGENFRLFSENGWGKQDLNIALDAHTWTWRLVGEWAPTIDGSQREAVLSYLTTVESATLDQIHEALRRIDKASLYVVLDRLRTSEKADERVIKEGKRKAYTYRLEHKGRIEQLNIVLNSANSSPISARDLSLTKNDFVPGGGDHRKPDQSSESYNDQLLPNDQVSTHTKVLNKGQKQPSNPDAEGVSAYLTPAKTRTSKKPKSPDTEGLQRIEHCIEQNPKPDHLEAKPDHRGVNPGSKVRYAGRNFLFTRLCGDKHLSIDAVAGDQATVTHEDWLVPQTIPVKELKPIRR